MARFKIPKTALSVLHTDVVELARDPEAYGLGEEESVGYRALLQMIDGDTLVVEEVQLLQVGEPQAAMLRCESVVELLTDLANAYDDMVEYGVGGEDPKFSRAASRSLGTLATKVRKECEKMKRNPSAMESMGWKPVKERRSRAYEHPDGFRIVSSVNRYTGREQWLLQERFGGRWNTIGTQRYDDPVAAAWDFERSRGQERSRNSVGAFLGGAAIGAAGLGIAQYAIRRTSGTVGDLSYKIGPSTGREYWIEIDSPEGFAFAETYASSPQDAEQNLLQWIGRNESELRRWLPERRKIFQIKQQNPKRGRKAKRGKSDELRQDWIEAPQGLIVDELYLARAYARARAEHFGTPQVISKHHAQNRWDIGPKAPLDRATWDFVEVVGQRHNNPSTSLSPATYVVYAGFKEPAGLMRYGGKHYYSDEPPWLRPIDLARDLYRKKGPRSKYRIVEEGAITDEEWERAAENQRSGKYARRRRNPPHLMGARARRMSNP